MITKRKMNKFIRDAEHGLKDVMISNLSLIAEKLIKDIMVRVRTSSDSKKPDAIKGLKVSGIYPYKAELKDALVIIAHKAYFDAQKEVPPKSKKLSEDVQFSKRRSRIIFKKLIPRSRYKSPPTKYFDKKLETMYFDLPSNVRKLLMIQRDFLVESQLADLKTAVAFQFSTSLFNTDSLDVLVADLQEAAGDFVLGRSISSGASVTGSKIVNQTRMEYLYGDKATPQVEAYVFINNHTDNRTPICESLAGTVFSPSDPNRYKFTPPLHYNCRSFIQPILKGNLGNRKIEKLKVSKSNEKYIQFSEKGFLDGE